MLISNSVAAAVAVVGYDLFQDLPNATIAAGQRITGVGLRGSAAAVDTKVRIMAGNVEVASIYNNNTGAPGRDDMLPVTYVHRGPPVRVYGIVTDAPATNPINIVANIV